MNLHINGRDDWDPGDYHADRYTDDDWLLATLPASDEEIAEIEARRLLHKVIDTVTSEALPVWWGPMSYRANELVCNGDPAMGKRLGKVLQAAYNHTRRAVIEVLNVEDML
jgi:hypothetical protein